MDAAVRFPMAVRTDWQRVQAAEVVYVLSQIAGRRADSAIMALEQGFQTPGITVVTQTAFWVSARSRSPAWRMSQPPHEGDVFGLDSESAAVGWTGRPVPRCLAMLRDAERCRSDPQPSPTGASACPESAQGRPPSAAPVAWRWSGAGVQDCLVTIFFVSIDILES